MTTPLQHYKKLQDISSDGMILELAPGPFEIAVGKCDGLAGQLLNWLSDQLPDDATQGDLEDILMAALWWSQLFAAMLKASDLKS